jgi:hypothetical protein
VEDMDIPEMEDVNMVKEYDHPLNHRLGKEGMNIVDIHMVEVEGMDMVEERPSNHWPKDEGTNMVKECPSNHRSEVQARVLIGRI